MYLFERLIWSHRTQSQENRDRSDDELRKEFGPNKVRIDPDAKNWGIHHRVEVEPTDAESLYACNDTYLDVRAAFQEEKRGLITFGFFSLVGVFGYYLFWSLTLNPGFHILFLGTTPWDRPIQTGDYFAVGIFFVLGCGVLYLLVKYAWPWIRTELFTQRHLVARFNRKTRHVYVNRPGYAGGKVTLAWEAASPAIQPDDPDHMGMAGFLAVAFPEERSGVDFSDFIFLGRPMRGNREIEGLWEYIRRYMEEGPQAVPRPKRLLPLWPSPVEPVRATFRFMSPMWRRSGKVVALMTGLVLSPLLIFHAFCHWVSLLLCWRPYWPRQMREAGRPGKPVPKLTELADFGPELAERIRYNDKKDEEKTVYTRRRRKKSAEADV